MVSCSQDFVRTRIGKSQPTRSRAGVHFSFCPVDGIFGRDHMVKCSLGWFIGCGNLIHQQEWGGGVESFKAVNMIPGICGHKQVTWLEPPSFLCDMERHIATEGWDIMGWHLLSMSLLFYFLLLSLLSDCRNFRFCLGDCESPETLCHSHLCPKKLEH